MLIRQIIAFVFLSTFSLFCLGHEPGLSSVDIMLKAGRIGAKVTFSLQDIEAFVPMDSDHDAEVTPVEQEAIKPEIARWVLAGVKMTIDGQVIMPEGVATVSFDDKNNAFIEFTYLIAIDQQLNFQSVLLNLLPANHKQFVTIKDQTEHGVAEKMLSQDNSSIDFNLDNNYEEGGQVASSVSKVSTFRDFLVLGIEHILTGYDHLLFLLSLLIVTRSFWPAFKIITYFTIAHSITLALASLNLIDIPASIVEPLIAVTIIYVALENIVREGKPKGRQWLTFFFGLVHGFGFAAVLREMSISSYETGILVPLFSFNLGVELGQITVTILVLPIIWWLHKQAKIEAKLTLVCSLLIALAGSYWLIERTVLS